MTEIKFLEQRRILLDQKKELESAINEKYHKIVEDFKKDNSPVEKSKVYELLKNGNKRRGFNRFVIYTQEVSVFDISDVFIRVGGWWLDSNNIPKKWDNMTVFGVENPAVFKLSENQNHEKHPETKD